MKKIALIVSMIFLLSFKAGDKKEIVIKFKGDQIQQLWQVLGFAKANLQTSQAPAIDVNNAVKIIDSLQKSIQTQYSEQIKDTTIK